MKKIIFPCLIVALSAGIAEAQYASLAIDQRAGDQYGWAVNYGSQSEADERALSECEDNSSEECHIVLRFTGGCGAYVVERGNSSLYGWGTADTRAAAENRAMDEARTRGGQNLAVRVWGCNGGELTHSQEGEELLKGVFFYHFKYSSYWNRCFVTDALYQPAVAQKQGEKWVWVEDAEQVMTPVADKWMDVIEENLYGFLGKNKDKAYTRKKLDWAGKNEVDHNNGAFSLSITERRKIMEGAVRAAINLCKDEGAELVKVDVGRR